MVPQSFKDILSNGENATLYQIIAMLIFVAFFTGLIIFVFSRPKKFYREQENAPLDDGYEDSFKL